MPYLIKIPLSKEYFDRRTSRGQIDKSTSAYFILAKSKKYSKFYCFVSFKINGVLWKINLPFGYLDYFLRAKKKLGSPLITRDKRFWDFLRRGKTPDFYSLVEEKKKDKSLTRVHYQVPDYAKSESLLKTTTSNTTNSNK